jgi:hypothetical protein
MLQFLDDNLCSFQLSQQILQSEREIKKGQWLRGLFTKVSFFCQKSWTDGHSPKNMSTNFIEFQPWLKWNRGNWPVYCEVLLTQTFNWQRNNDLNQGSSTECSSFNSWQSRPWLKWKRGKWPVYWEALLTQEFNGWKNNDLNQANSTEYQFSIRRLMMICSFLFVRTYR